jgi:hypothetical protein
MDRLTIIVGIVLSLACAGSSAAAKTGDSPAPDLKTRDNRIDCYAVCEPSYQRCLNGCAPIKDSGNKTGCYSGCDFGLVGCLKRCEPK